MVMIVYDVFIQLNHKMEEKNNADLQKATSRRSRKDQEGRDFQCGCGKRYLSYPALYTHIKTKHEGRQPEGTLKTGSTQPQKKSKVKFDEQTRKKVYSYFQKDELRIFSQLGEAGNGTVALNSRIKKDSVCKQIYDSYINLMKQQNANLHCNSPLELALTIYLINIGEYVNQKVYEQFLLFAKIARESYMEHGDQVCKAYFSRKDHSQFIISSFSNSQVRYFPIMCNFITTSYIPITYDKEVNRSLMELLLFDFCNWLLQHKLTNISASLSPQFKLDYKAPLYKSKSSINKNDHLREVNSKDNKDEEEDQSIQLSDNEQIDEDYIEVGERKQSGSKQKLQQRD